MAVLLSIAMNCQAGQLDGTHCKVTVTPEKVASDKGEKAFDDKLGFYDGKFVSAVFLAKGFEPTEYNGEAEPDEAEFALEQKSQTDGVLNWQGQIRDKHVTGKLTWAKKDGTTLSYTFTGTKD
jgi:hypothetical protein